MGDFFAPLRVRAYRHLFSAQVIALVGTGLTTVALSLLAYQLAGDHAGFALGVALALKMVAYVGIAPLMGGIAHRLPRKQVLVALDLSRAALVACLPFVEHLWQVYALIFLLNACSAGFTPLFQATIPDILDDESLYTRALSLSRLAYDLENLLSPLLAAAALAVLSYHGLFTLNAVAFGLSAALVVSVALPSPRPVDRPRGIIANSLFGLRAYWQTPRLRATFALSWTIASASATVIVNTVLLARSHFGLDERGVAMFYAAAGAGSMITALALPHILKDTAQDRLVMISGGAILLAGLGLSVAGLSWLPLALVGWGVIGVGLALAQTPIGRVLRRSCHASDRPALFSAQFSLSHGCWLVCYPLAGASAAAVGLEGSLAGMAAVGLVGLGLAYLLWPNPDPHELLHHHPAHDHSHPHSHDDPHHHHHHHHEHTEGGEDSQQPHSHHHHHPAQDHVHPYVIDGHHQHWPR